MFSARSALVAVAFCVILTTAAFAQVTTADIVGRVTDSTRRRAARRDGDHRAPRHARHPHGHLERHRATSCSTSCRSARYTVKIELQGFITQTARVSLSTGDRARFDAKLQLGQVAENVTVTGGVAARADRLGDRSARSSPRRRCRICRSAAATSSGSCSWCPAPSRARPNSLASGNRPDDRRQTSAVSINGSMDNQNNHLIDGIDNNERAIGTVGVKPSIDAIAEVKVQTSMYTAEVGRTAGGVVNIITKSG